MKCLKLKYMNFLSAFFLLLILPVCVPGITSAGQSTQVDKKLTLEEAEEIVDIFLNSPTPDNYQILKETIYPILNKDDEEKRTLVKKLLEDCVLEGDGIWIIEYEIFIGNRFMALFGRRLLDFSDGLSAEILFGLFGKLIRINPELFLTIFKEDIGKPVLELAVTKPIFLTGTDKYERYERHDLIKRIEALTSITDPELRGVRDYCIRILEREL